VEFLEIKPAIEEKRKGWGQRVGGEKRVRGRAREEARGSTRQRLNEDNQGQGF
jgi:hypothetical protein